MDIDEAVAALTHDDRRKIIFDKSLLGTFFIQVFSDGTARRLDPSRVTVGKPIATEESNGH